MQAKNKKQRNAYHALKLFALLVAQLRTRPAIWWPMATLAGKWAVGRCPSQAPTDIKAGKFSLSLGAGVCVCVRVSVFVCICVCACVEQCVFSTSTCSASAQSSSPWQNQRGKPWQPQTWKMWQRRFATEGLKGEYILMVPRENSRIAGLEWSYHKLKLFVAQWCLQKEV